MCHAADRSRVCVKVLLYIFRRTISSTFLYHAQQSFVSLYDKSNDDRAIMALNRIDEIMDDTPEDRIKKYREQIAELEEKIRFEEGRSRKKTGVTLALPVNA